jgi:oxygen-independent coproporphyrinogen-3 oxidase
MLGLYVHIPFCISKCLYCDFYSLTDVPALMDRYIDALLSEADSYRGSSFATLYIGGGTPSLLGCARLEKLVNGLSRRFDLEDLQEATIEVNPDSAGGDFLATAYGLGIRRVSIGAQSLNGDELKKSGRVHDRRQVLDAIDAALASGFQNISADVMIGLPGQTAQSIDNTLDILIGAGINHISAYCLSIEEGTAFFRSPPPDLPGEDDQACLFESAIAMLEMHGFVHYEISNFAMPGLKCQHNLNYWKGGEYYGLGPAAASHTAGTRFRNAACLERYLDGPVSIREEEERLDEGRKVGEEAMLRLRLVEEGLDIKEMAGKYGHDYINNLEARLDELVSRQMLVRDGDIFRLPRDRVLTSNSVFIDVIG